ncbi:MAG: LamG domain-containing protein [Planctomycetes bacterium]|nr:LamG domain-containing protein [Planctomycetota bacterium]MBL7145219.1 LamG domain-containing protein [Phycisphaerae bacterium]
MTRLTIICIGFIIVSLMLTGQSYAEVNSENILGIWLLDEGNGDITEDSSGNGNDGTLGGGPTWIDGVYGKALDFSGSSSYVDCGNAETLNVDVFSVSFWCNIPSTQSWNHIVSRGEHHGGGNPGAVNWGVMMYADQETILYELYNDTVKPSISADTTTGQWHHVVATFGGAEMQLYHDGELAGTSPATGVLLDENLPFIIGAQSRAGGPSDYFSGSIDEVGYFNIVLTPEDIEMIMNNGLAGIAGGQPLAQRPNPEDGAIHADTWVSLSWRPGDFALSHDVYIGDNFDAVNEGAEGTFIGNQAANFIVVGFPGFAYPDGLVPGTTYYWRIDEINDADPNSPWKGDVWSFSIPPKTAYSPDPADNAESVDVDVKLRWTGGFGSKMHYVYFGDNFDDVSNATGGLPQGSTVYTPGPLKMARTYYWRVDEFDILATHKGDVWSFVTEGAVESLNPANGAVGVTQTPILTWTPGVYGSSHEIYFGTDADAVKNADTSSPEYKGSGNLGSESYDPGQLEWNTIYYWRIDEADSTNPNSPWTGPLWSFATADFLIIDDFESYNDLDESEPASNRIYLTWLDGFDNPAINGSIVGHTDPPFAEQTIIHGGSQSMPMSYDNGVGKSEATLTLTSNRDWTVNGLDTLTIWFRGEGTNAAENLYVALNGSAVVNHNNPNAALKSAWTRWDIKLQAFADQGVDLTNVNTITLGLGNRANPTAGGAGMMYFDDIRLYAPAP